MMVHAQAMCRDYYTLEFMDRSVDTSPIAPALAAFFDNVLDRSVAQLNFKVRCALDFAAQVCVLDVSTGQVSLFKVCISVHQAEQHCAVLVVSNGTLITQYVSLAWNLRLQIESRVT